MFVTHTARATRFLSIVLISGVLALSLIHI